MLGSVADSPAWRHTTDYLLKDIRDAVRGSDALSDELPHLRSLLDDYLDDGFELDRAEFHRRLLRVFRDAPRDSTYQEHLAILDDDERQLLEKFVADDAPVEEVGRDFDMGMSLGIREHLSHMLQLDTVKIGSGGPVHIRGLSDGDLAQLDGVLHKFVKGLGNLLLTGVMSLFCAKKDPEGTGEKVLHTDEIIVYRESLFQNWGLTVTDTPVFTCIPSTVRAVQQIVRYAKMTGMGVRCAGFRHSWAPVFGRKGQIIISLLGLHEAAVIPNTTAFKFLAQDAPSELETIEPMEVTADNKTVVRVGSAVTNERLRRWCVGNKKLTLPLNVIMVEITLGGSNATICHGSGRRNRTLSDLVRKVEYVDAHGELRVVDKPQHIRAAAGCFGLMGVVTHLWLELDPMTYAIMKPRHVPTVRAVPPPPGMKEDDIPPALRLKLTEAERRADQAAFEAHANDDFYAEWFWFPYSETVWINCWDVTLDDSDVEEYPDGPTIFLAFVSQFALNVLQFAPALRDLVDALGRNEAVTALIGKAARMVLPSSDIKTYLPEALHFQRGIQNVRVLNMEVEMPLVPSRRDPDRVDYASVQRAWWDAILTCYRHSQASPQRMPLEMRIMGGSDVVMAAQRGNRLGTCSIEILTLYSGKDEWVPYAQEVLDKWLDARDAYGNKLKVRPHWAKQWTEFQVDGQPWAVTLKRDTYKEEIKEFMATLAEIGKEHKWTLNDIKKRFSNEFLDDFFFEP